MVTRSRSGKVSARGEIFGNVSPSQAFSTAVSTSKLRPAKAGVPCSLYAKLRRLCRIWPMALLVCMTGCLSRPNLVRQSFAFPPPAPAKVRESNGPVLAVRRIYVAPPFDDLQMTYRTGAFSYERDPYAGFLAAPAESLAETVRAGLRDTGAFREVDEPGSLEKPELEAEIDVLALYGDFRNRAQPKSVMELRFVVSRAANRSLVLQKTYEEEVPLTARTAAAVFAGWNEDLNQILRKFGADISQVVR